MRTPSARRLAALGAVVLAAAPAAPAGAAVLSVQVFVPSSITGSYSAEGATFGPLRYSLSAYAARPASPLACTALAPGSLTNRIAVVDRGTCIFTVKAKNVQDAGGVGMVVVNNVFGPMVGGMGGVDDTVTIPAAIVLKDEAQKILDALAAPTSVGITMSRAVAAIAAAPATLAFGEQAATTIGAPQAVTLTNTGNSLLHVTNASFVGEGRGNFLISGDSCTGVAVGTSCEIAVRFAPVAAGTPSATLRVTSDAESAVMDVATLSGTATAPPTWGVGPQGPQGEPGPPGTAGSSTTVTRLVVVAYRATVGAKRVVVGYAATAPAAAALLVQRVGGRAVIVARGTSNTGDNRLVWNRRLSGRPARPGTYRLTVRAASGSAPAATSTLTVRLKAARTAVRPSVR